MFGIRAVLLLIVFSLNMAFAAPALSAGHQGITDCFVCHDFVNGSYGNTAQGNLRWVRGAIAWPAGTASKPVVFTSFSSGLPANGTMADGNDGRLDGPCEVCHTQTAYHTKSGDKTAHFDGEDCIVCHPHFPDQGDYFTPQLVGPQSHETHLSLPKGPRVPDCTSCHKAGNYSLFSDDKSLADTAVCDPCHSPDGIYDGVDDAVLGAKPNWANGIYDADTGDIRAGKENWCATCHDNGYSITAGAVAPNVMGDGVIYGYNVSGHGRGDILLGCDACHDLSSEHTDGNQRTYRAILDNYVTGYRLAVGMDVPRYDSVGEEAYGLCATCHDLDQLLSRTSNFRKDPKPFGYHEIHLNNFFSFFDAWDSDWNGTVDSAMSCMACHNVHGSPMRVGSSLAPNPVMIRHGELMSRPGTNAKVPALDFRWYKANGTTETNVRAESRIGGLLCGAVPDLATNHTCYGCHATGLITYPRTPIEQAGFSINGPYTTDSADTMTNTFAPGDDIGCYVPLTISGTASGYYIDTNVVIRSITGNVDWSISFGTKETLPAGTHKQHWTRQIPMGALAGTEAVSTITVKMYDAPQGTLLQESQTTLAIHIEEGSQSDVGVTVEAVETTDSAGNPKKTFAPGDTVRCYVRFTVTGDAAHYYIDTNGKIFNKSGGVAWTKDVGDKETLDADTYERTWNETIPSEAVEGTDACLRFNIKMYDEPDGALLANSRKSKNFAIQEEAPPRDTITIDEVWTTDLSGNEKTTFVRGDRVRCYVRFTVTGIATGYNCDFIGKLSGTTTGDVEWKKGLVGEEAISSGTHERYWEKRIPTDAAGNTDARLEFRIKLLDTSGNFLRKDIKDTTVHVAEETSVSHNVLVEEVWTTDIADNPTTTFSRRENARYYVRFTITGPAAGYAVDVRGLVYNTSGDAAWQRTFGGEEALAAGTYVRYWDKIIPFAALTGTTARVRCKVSIYDAPGGNLLNEHKSSSDISIVEK